MFTTRPIVPSRPAARPIPGAVWEADVADASKVAAELAKLWASHGGEGAKPTSGEEGTGLRILVRATTLNLVAVAKSRADQERVIEAVLAMSDFHPSRATILFADPDRTAETDDTLHVRAMLVEQEATKARPVVRFECVVVEGSAANERTLASIAAPLLVVDLPDFLWWTADSIVGSALFGDLWTRSDRVIVDTSSARHPASELRELARRATEHENAPTLSDFAWSRTATWRAMVTQFFDIPAARETLEQVDTVEITYGFDEGARRSGFSAALLTAGWLASRLGWEAPGALVPNRGEAHGWHVTFRAGPRGEPREIALVLHPEHEPSPWPSLTRVTLLAGGGSAARYTVERANAEELHSASRIGDAPEVSRSAFDVPEGESALLGDALRIYSRDPVYEAALVVAADLAPTGERFGSDT